MVKMCAIYWFKLYQENRSSEKVISWGLVWVLGGRFNGKAPHLSWQATYPRNNTWIQISIIFNVFLKISAITWKILLALAGVAQWIECSPRTSLRFNSRLGHMPGLWSGSPVGSVWEATTHWCFSPSLSPSLPLSLKINK